jgi:putative acetyltransferase
MRIDHDDPTRPDVLALLAEHLDEMRRLSPPESVHALDPAALTAPGISFWTVRQDGLLLGCAALKQLGPTQGEIKSMRTPAHLRGRGAARLLLSHLVDTARARGYRQLYLETGAMAAFLPAHRLYQGFGFTFCAPFGDYVDDPHSVFMSLAL